MKYSEYLQLRDLLEQNNISFEDYKKDPKLYEGVIGNIMSKLGTGLLNLARRGVKYAISKGINKDFQTKLDTDIEKIKNDIEAHLGLEGKTPPKDSPVQKVLTAIENKSLPRKEASQEIIKYMKERVENESKIVVKSIDNKKGLTDEDKDYLKIYWGSKIADIKLNLLAQLGIKKIVNKEDIELESDALNKNLNKYLTILLTDANKKAKQRGKPAKPQAQTSEPTTQQKQTTQPQPETTKKEVTQK